MNRVLLLVAWFGFVIVFGYLVAGFTGLGQAGKASESKKVKAMNETKPNVKFTLEQRSPEGDRQSSTSVLLTLTNEGPETVWVNKRMAWNRPTSPAVFREVWFNVEAPDKTLIEFECRVKIGSAEEKDYVLLPSKQVVTKTYTLSDCFPLKKGEKYKVKAFYQDGSAEKNKPAPGLIALTELLESNVIEIIGE